MANIISDETIEYVGILAKLELNEEEKEQAKKDMEKISLRSTKSRKKRHSRDHLVENVQEIETDLFNLTSI